MLRTKQGRLTQLVVGTRTGYALSASDCTASRRLYCFGYSLARVEARSEQRNLSDMTSAKARVACGA